MLQSYPAELLGNQLHWLGAVPPNFRSSQKVLVVIEVTTPASSHSDETEHSDPVRQPRYQLRDLAGRLQWTGDAVQAQREQRDAW